MWSASSGPVFLPKRGFGRLAIGGLRVVHGRKVDRVSERGGDLGTESRSGAPSMFGLSKVTRLSYAQRINRDKFRPGAGNGER